MIFESLYKSAEDGELLLTTGGLCRWHLRQDGQLTIREILVLPHMRRTGIGKAMLIFLKARDGATSIFAKCPADLDANYWYEKMGFELEDRELAGKEGGRRRWLNLWRLPL